MATTETQQITEGPGKGTPFFDRAKTVAESGNLDYAIDMYIEGLKREPGLISMHEANFRVGFQRKAKGGKPPGGIFGPKLPMKGKTPKDQLINAAYQLAMDPGNIPHMQAYIKAAVALNLPEVVRWVGPMLKTANQTKGKKKEVYLELAKQYDLIKDFANAAEAIAEAMKVSPNDMTLNTMLKDISAKHTMQQANYDKTEEGGAVPGFKDSLKDANKTKELLQEDALAKSLEFRGREVEKAREEYEASPLDHRAITKYASALRAMEDESFDNQAIDVLTKAYADTDTYQYRKTVDEIRIRQHGRQAAALRDQLRAKPDDVELKEKYKVALSEQLQIELEAFKDWTEHYPTDMNFMYEYGVRLFMAKKFDDAIHAFQQSQVNPNKRINSLYYLGMSFEKHKMIPEATETFRTAVSEYDLIESGNDLAKKLYYALADVYEKNNMFKESADIFSKITRWEIGYRDARARLQELRKKIGQ